LHKLKVHYLTVAFPTPLSPDTFYFKPYGYSVVNYLVDVMDTTVVSLIFHTADMTVVYRPQVDNRHDRRVYRPPVDDTRRSCLPCEI